MNSHRLRILLCALGLLGSTLIGCKDNKPLQTAPQVTSNDSTAPAIVPAKPAPVEQAEAPQAFRELCGYVPQPKQAEQFIKSLPAPTLEQANPQLFQARGPPTAHLSQTATDRKPVLLYRALLGAYKAKYGKPFVVGTQKIGDCTSWGWAHACDIVLAIDFLSGRSGDFHMVATEATYGLGRVEGAGLSYNRSGDGSYGAAMAKGVTNFGLLFRKDYSGLGSAEYDLRIYSGAKAKSWGAYGCGGKNDAGRLDAEAKRHAVKQVAIVASFTTAAAAIENGYPVPVCSGRGFNSTRDAEGFLRASGSWPHCMCFVGVRYDRPGLLCLNSWGPEWVSGGKWPTLAQMVNAKGGDGAQLDPLPYLYPEGPQLVAGPKWEGSSDMPDGSFWVDAKVVDSMLSGRDSYAVSNLVGFPRQELNLIKGL